MPAWCSSLDESICLGESHDPSSPSWSGKVGHVETIKTSHPSHLHEMFRHAQSAFGGLATCMEPSDSMNEKSGQPGETRPTLNMSRKQVSEWFFKNAGKEKSAMEKPLPTTDHCKPRMAWARKWFAIHADPAAPVGHLDEK